MSEELLQVPCTLEGIKSLAVGGFRLVFDTASNPAVQNLVPHVQKTNFILFLVPVENDTDATSAGEKVRKSCAKRPKRIVKQP